MMLPCALVTEKQIMGSPWTLITMSDGRAFWVWKFRSAEEFSIPSSRNET